MNRVVKYPLTLERGDGGTLREQGNVARALWNLIHTYNQFYAKRKRYPSLKQLDGAVRQGRKDLSWLAALPAQASQQVIKNYKQAWKNFFEGVSEPPTFKKRGTRRAIDIPQARDLGFKKLNNKWMLVRIPKIGWRKIRVHHRLPEKVTGARLVEDSPGKWTLIVRGQVLVDTTPPPLAVPVVGVDLGVAKTVSLSTGEDFLLSELLSPGERKHLYVLERKAARQKQAGGKGKPRSRRYQNTLDKIAKIRKKKARRREDFAHQVSHRLSKMARCVAFEDLKIQNMTKSAKGTKESPGVNVAAKSGLNKAILEQGWGDLRQKTKYKCEQRGGGVKLVPSQYTSQKCHRCGYTDANNRDSQAKFACKNHSCGWEGNADTNAAINIANLTDIQLRPERSWQDVEPNANRQAVKRQNQPQLLLV